MTHNQISYMLGRRQAAASEMQARASQSQAETAATHEQGLWLTDYAGKKRSIAQAEYKYNTAMEDAKYAWNIVDHLIGGIWSIAGLFG